MKKRFASLLCTSKRKNSFDGECFFFTDDGLLERFCLRIILLHKVRSLQICCVYYKHSMDILR